MPVFILQTLLLLAIAFILGCIIGCLLRSLFAKDETPALAAGAAATATTAAAVTAAARSADAAPAMPAPVARPSVRTPDAEPVAFAAAPVAKAEKPASRPKPKPAPKAKPAMAAAVTAPAEPDDLKRIRGIGRQNEARLNALGVNRFAQIAAWTAKDEADYGERLAFPGRIEREEWVKQAKILASGKSTPFSRRVARGQVESSTGKGTVGDLGRRPKTLKKARSGGPDNLTLIDGVGNAIERKLHELGIYHFDQVAGWSDAEATWIGNEIGFPGRVQRENWIGDARTLARGGMTDHARRVEQGKIGTSRKSTGAEKKSRK